MQRRLAAVHEPVVAQARTAVQHQDVESLRLAIAQAFTSVWLTLDGSTVMATEQEMIYSEGKWTGSTVLPLAPRHTHSPSGVPE